MKRDGIERTGGTNGVECFMHTAKPLSTEGIRRKAPIGEKKVPISENNSIKVWWSPLLLYGCF